MDKSKWQQEFDALPEWAQKLVTGMRGNHGYGFGTPSKDHVCGMAKEYRDRTSEVYFLLDKDGQSAFADGVFGLGDLARAMTAPWPPPVPEPHEEMTTANIVEMMTAGDDDCAFDQPCHYGHRVNGHAVYCHNEAWPDSPRKCRRNRDDFLHEDCPGFYPSAPRTETAQHEPNAAASNVNETATDGA